MILQGSHAGLASTIRAAIKLTISLDSMSDDFAAAMIADWREFVDRTFETVECMSIARRDDFKRQIIVVTTYLAFRHRPSFS
jgi:hypothetical protein